MIPRDQTSADEKDRTRRLQRTASGCLYAVLVAVALWMIRDFIPAVVWAAVIAISAQRFLGGRALYGNPRGFPLDVVLGVTAFAAGTIYLLRKSPFGYFAGVTVLVGGILSLLFSHANARGTSTPLYPGSGTAGLVAFVIAIVGGVAIIAATALRRPLAAHIAMSVLVVGSVAAAYLVFTAALPAPGYALDPRTHVPVGTAFPGYVRVLTGPFNIAGALCLVFGAIYSAYIYMPKRKVLRAKYGAAAVGVNMVASLPGAVAALLARKLNSRVPATILIALGAFIPGVTSGLNRFGVTWSFFLGEFLGVLLIFAGFLVSEEVFRNVRLGVTIWSRRSSLKSELG